jgi:phosphoribosylanthranilate isomerase
MTKIKICGIKTLRNALIAIDAGADYLGFNFYPKSPRFVDKETCAQITSVLKREHPNVKLVGVFVNLPVEEIKNILNICSLDLAQLHGDESPKTFSKLAPRAFKAFRGIPDEEIKLYARSEAPSFLVDATLTGSYGGTGITADWSAAAKLAIHHPLFLAGGLKPENVAEAVRQVNPWGVDVASGVESRPGEKDAKMIKDFVQAVHSVKESVL